MENAFNPQEFAALLKKLVGPRKAQDVASLAGISKFQLSRRLAGTLDAPPRKKTLRLLANCAANGVTYEDLLRCAGYPADESSASSSSYGKQVKIARACLLSAISDRSLPVRPSKDSPKASCDFELLVGSDPEVTWMVSCLTSDMPQLSAEQTYDDHLQELMYARLAAYAKYSFLTDSRRIFDACVRKAPVNLNVNVSVILCSLEDLEVACEQMLSRCISSPIPNAYELGNKDGSSDAD